MSDRATPSSAASELPATLNTRLRGRWLRLSLVGWLVFVVGLLASFVSSIPAKRQEVDLEYLRAHLFVVEQETMQPTHVSRLPPPARTALQ